MSPFKKFVAPLLVIMVVAAIVMAMAAPTVAVASGDDVTVTVQLIDSNGAGLAGGDVQYYHQGWHDLGTTDSNGQVVATLPAGSYSFAVTYNGTREQKDHVDISTTNPVVFQTINMVVHLQDSTGAALKDGDASYYAKGWHDMGATDANGNASAEMLPGSYSFAVTYNGTREQKNHVDISTTNPVVFQTINMVVSLQRCDGTGLAGGDAQYYAKGWHDMGTTDANGNASAEMLPGSYSFAVTYQGTRNQQNSVDITATNPLVFNTTAVTLYYYGNVKYYAKGWHTFTKPTMDLLPGTYWFSFDNKHKTQLTISGCEMAQAAVVVQLKDSQDNPLSGGDASYYNAGWHDLGTTDSNGEVFTLLDPGTYSFAVVYQGTREQKDGVDVTTTNPVVFQTLNMVVSLQRCDGTGLAGGDVSYYAFGWHDIGATDANGNVNVEMLPGSYSFAVVYQGTRTQKDAVDITANNPLVFNTTALTLYYYGNVKYYAFGWHTFTKPTMDLLQGTYTFSFDGRQQDITINGCEMSKAAVVVQLKDSQDNPLSGGDVSYYNAGWHDLGTTDSNGEVFTMTDPGTYSFAVNYQGTREQKDGVDVTTTNPVVFQTLNMVVHLQDSAGNPLQNGNVQYYGLASAGWQDMGATDANGNASAEMLPGSYSFAVTYNGTREQKDHVDISTTNPVVFQTINLVVHLQDSAGNPLQGGNAQYYGLASAGWQDMGATDANGNASAEMLPGSYSFAATYNGARQQQDGVNITTTNPVIFTF